jgi:hypothetical protein
LIFASLYQDKEVRKESTINEENTFKDSAVELRDALPVLKEIASELFQSVAIAQESVCLCADTLQLSAGLFNFFKIYFRFQFLEYATCFGYRIVCCGNLNYSLLSVFCSGPGNMSVCADN